MGKFVRRRAILSTVQRRTNLRLAKLRGILIPTDWPLHVKQTIDLVSALSAVVHATLLYKFLVAAVNQI
jgi:hypothetical protein